MNMTISGSGNIPAGEYKEISISGSGRLHGFVRCENFYTAGSSEGESIECFECFQVSGSSSFSGKISAEFVGVSGSLSCDEIESEGEVEVSGSAKCDGKVKCDILSVSGSIKVGKVEADKVKIRGVINCDGLLNADILDIKFDREMNIGSIGGSKITIIRENRRKIGERIPLFSLFVKKANGNVCVDDSVEGDEIALEYVNCPRVTGRVVSIGAGCDIDLVEYEDTVEISPDAKVGKTEKI